MSANFSENYLKVKKYFRLKMIETMSKPKKSSSNPHREKYYKIQIHCDACNRSYNKVQWYKHYKTKKHKKNLEKLNKMPN